MGHHQTSPSGGAPAFGHGSRVYNVIDSRQSYLQDVVVAGLRALGFKEQADASVHFSYEMVALYAGTCVELGIPLSDEDKQAGPYVEVSGRKGLGVKADDLIDTLIAKALEEVDSRHPEATRKSGARSDPDRGRRAALLHAEVHSKLRHRVRLSGSAQLRGRNRPYVQYAAVRAATFCASSKSAARQCPDFAVGPECGLDGTAIGGRRLLAIAAGGFARRSAIERAVTSGEPAHVARYAFQLAQAFNTFYHDIACWTKRIEEKRTFLLWMTDYFRSNWSARSACSGSKCRHICS